MFIDIAVSVGAWKVRILRTPDGTDPEADELEAADTDDVDATESDAGLPGHTDATLQLPNDYVPMFGFAPIPAPWDDEE